MPALLELLDLDGRIVTADAMHGQRGTAGAIRAPGGDYVLALKGNQGTLHEDVKLFLDDPGCEENLLIFQSVDDGHGRIETRAAAISTDMRLSLPDQAGHRIGARPRWSGPASPF